MFKRVTNQILKGHRLEIFIMLLTLLVVLAIVLSVNTILFTTVYWIVRTLIGDFPISFLLAYTGASLYLTALTCKVALESYRRDISERPPSGKPK